MAEQEQVEKPPPKKKGKPLAERAKGVLEAVGKGAKKVRDGVFALVGMLLSLPKLAVQLVPWPLGLPLFAVGFCVLLVSSGIGFDNFLASPDREDGQLWTFVAATISGSALVFVEVTDDKTGVKWAAFRPFLRTLASTLAFGLGAASAYLSLDITQCRVTEQPSWYCQQLYRLGASSRLVEQAPPEPAPTEAGGESATQTPPPT